MILSAMVHKISEHRSGHIGLSGRGRADRGRIVEGSQGRGQLGKSSSRVLTMKPVPAKVEVSDLQEGKLCVHYKRGGGSAHYADLLEFRVTKLLLGVQQKCSRGCLLIPAVLRFIIRCTFI